MFPWNKKLKHDMEPLSLICSTDEDLCIFDGGFNEKKRNFVMIGLYQNTATNFVVWVEINKVCISFKKVNDLLVSDYRIIFVVNKFFANFLSICPIFCPKLALNRFYPSYNETVIWFAKNVCIFFCFMYVVPCAKMTFIKITNTLKFHWG